MNTEDHEIGPWDIVVIVAYFVGILGVGFWSSKISKRNSVSGYFLASRNMHWIPVGASLFVSNIGCGHFIGIAGQGSTSGLAPAAFEFPSMFSLLLLGWIFLPTYTSANVYTMPEYLQLRFGGQRIRVFLSILSLLLYIFTKISVELYAGALFIKLFFNINLYFAVGLILAVAALFTVGGGLTTVIWTDFIQSLLMIVGAIVLTVLTYIRVGGYSEIMNNFVSRGEPTDNEYIGYRSDNTSCSEITPYYNHFLRPATDPDLPWPGMLFIAMSLLTWYWCTDQVIVQRALSAKTVSHAKAGCVLAGLFKVLPIYLMVIPGMASRMLWPNEVGCSNPKKCEEVCGNQAGCSNIAYPLLVLRVLPEGLTGLMLSAMLAAVISSITSIFNSASTIFTIDIWKRFRSDAGEFEQVIVGRIFVVVLATFSIIWIPFIEGSQNSELFVYINTIVSYLCPPLSAVFIFAVVWPRINEKGAFWGLMIGSIAGMARFISEMTFQVPICASHLPDPRPAILSDIHYLNFGMILFIFSCIIIVTISLLTQPIDPIHLHRLTFWSRFSEEVRMDIDSKTGSIDIYSVTNNRSIDESTNMNNNKTKLNDSQSKGWLYAICCIQSNKSTSDSDMRSHQKDTPNISKEEKAKLASQLARENPFWKNVCNVFALMAFAVGVFVWGFYA